MTIFVHAVDWLIAVFKQWYGWAGGATVAIVLLIGQSWWNWQPSRKQLLTIFGFGLLYSMFAAWMEQRDATVAAENKTQDLQAQLQRERDDRTPDLRVFVRQATTLYYDELQSTVVILSVDIINRGADTVALIGKTHYKSQTSNDDIEIMNIQDDPFELEIPGIHQRLIVRPNEWLRVKANNGIARGKMVSGRLPLRIPGNRIQEFKEGGVVITFGVQDYLGKEVFATYQADPAPAKGFKTYPGEQLRQP